MKKILILTITTFSLVLSSFAPAAYAQTATKSAPSAAQKPAGQALEIGPPVVSVTGDPGQIVKAQLSLRDVSANKLIVTNEINDFGAADENGTPKLILSQNSNSNEPSPYSIKKWIAPLPKFTLVPKQVQTLTLNITIPKNAAPGGYYGVVRFSGTPPGMENQGVSLAASLGALVFLKVNGNAKEEVNTKEFYAGSGSLTNVTKNWLFEAAPVFFVERFENTGNMFESPAGQITINDMFGKYVTALPVNQPPHNILPGSIRKFVQEFGTKEAGGKFLFGKYTATMNVTYGTGVTPLAATVTFWIIPYRIIGAIILGLIALFFIIWFGLRAYANRVVNQNRGGRRR